MTMLGSDFVLLADLADRVKGELENRGLKAVVRFTYDSGVETTFWVFVRDPELVIKPDRHFPEVWSKSRSFNYTAGEMIALSNEVYGWCEEEIPDKPARHTAFLLEKVGAALEEAEKLSNGDMAEHLKQVTDLLKAGRAALASNLLTFRRAA